MSVEERLQKTQNPAGRRLWRRDTILYALAVQFAILAVTVFVVVVKPGSREEPEFTGGKTIYLPQRELEHRVALAEFQQSAAKPLLLEKLVTSALLPPDLPSLPTVPKMDFNPLENADFLTRDAQALLAQSGMMGAVSGLKTATSTAAFFGVEANGERIVMVVNTSVSLRNKADRRGVSWERIQEEVTNVIDGLGASTLFGIVQFSQGVRVFTEYLAPATPVNREAARVWVKKRLRGNPKVQADDVWFGHEAAFEAAFRLEPDVIFLVTDGVLDRREQSRGRISYPEIRYGEFIGSVRAFQRGSTRDVAIHVIGFELRPKDLSNMERLAGEFGGSVRAF